MTLVAAMTVNFHLSLRFSQQRKVRDLGGLQLPWIDAQPFAAVLEICNPNPQRRSAVLMKSTISRLISTYFSL
jgi:hypothetical protein